MDVPLYDRAKIAWSHNARLFVSVHCNASGEEENPLWNNGFSIYWYQPQSLQLARNIHAQYMKQMSIPDHGLYFADLAVCRMTQMPAVLTEQAYIIVPDQEIMIFSPKFRKLCATAILNGIKQLVAKTGS
jgi:N-acetylmuramoyl-L-alanine amidase